VAAVTLLRNHYFVGLVSVGGVVFIASRDNKSLELKSGCDVCW